jgi:hypothetical protein
MYLKFGKHSDKSVKMVILKNPAHIAWILTVRNPNGRLAMVKIEALRLIRIFDTKPFLRNCQGRECTKPATLLTVYADNVYHPTWWCDDCDPYQMGARDGKLSLIKTYYHACLHHMMFHTPKIFLKDLVKTIAAEKGLPKRVGMKEAEEFFGGYN